MERRKPAEVFPPGDFIEEELEARGWLKVDLAEILGKTTTVVSELITGKRRLTEDMARGLAEAFGTSAQYWLNLETAYRLNLSETSKPVEGDIARRARLYDRFPVRQIINRGWIEPSTNIEVLETRVCEFYGLSGLDKEPELTHAARKRDQIAKSPLQQAWLFRVKRLAEAVSVGRYTAARLAKACEKLRDLVETPEEIRHIPAVLAEAGIRLVVVEQLPTSKMDGACFWLDKDSPVVALTLRYDRIDNFWFTLIHEIKHIENGHAKNEAIVDTDLVGGSGGGRNQSEEEVLVNGQAADYLLPRAALEDFIARNRPSYGQQQIVGFARRMKVHSGIVVGQLQNRGEISYAHQRKLLTNVRRIIISTALCDGWGNTISI